MQAAGKRKRGRPRSFEARRTIQVRVSAELEAQLAALSQHTQRSRNTELRIALERHLEAEGFRTAQAS
jgi:predicted DNA-binding protein